MDGNQRFRLKTESAALTTVTLTVNSERYFYHEEHEGSEEWNLMNYQIKLQYPLPVKYKGIKLDCGYRIDLLVNEAIIVELKSVDKILPIHQAQLLTYMKLADISIGLLINFNVKYLKDGIKRMVL